MPWAAMFVSFPYPCLFHGDDQREEVRIPSVSGGSLMPEMLISEVAWAIAVMEGENKMQRKEIIKVGFYKSGTYRGCGL